MPEPFVEVLKNIPDDEIVSFSDRVFSKEWPYTVNMCYFLQVCAEWRLKKSSIEATMLYYRDNLDSGIFVGMMRSGNKTFGLQVYALPGYEDLLQQVLDGTNLIPWQDLPLIQAVLPRHQSVVERVVANKELKANIYVNTTLQIIRPEIAKAFPIECPADTRLAPLTLLNVEEIYEKWPLNDVYTKEELVNTIQLNGGIGAFSSTSGRLLAWVMHTHHGAIGMLQTQEDVQRSGYAKLVTKALAKLLAERSIQPYAMINEINDKSLSLFWSIGFHQINRMKYYKVQTK